MDGFAAAKEPTTVKPHERPCATWVFVLAALVRRDATSTADVMREAFSLAHGEASVYLSHVSDVLEFLEDRGHVLRVEEFVGARRAIAWKITPAGRARFVELAAHLSELVQLGGKAA